MAFLNQFSKDKKTCKQISAKNVYMQHRGNHESVSDQFEPEAEEVAQREGVNRDPKRIWGSKTQEPDHNDLINSIKNFDLILQANVSPSVLYT